MTKEDKQHSKDVRTVNSNSELIDFVDVVVEIRGVAENRKLGGYVVAEWGGVLVDGLEQWPEALPGKCVVVTGKLRRDDSYVGGATPDGIQRGGPSSPVFLLEDPIWRVE